MTTPPSREQQNAIVLAISLGSSSRCRRWEEENSSRSLRPYSCAVASSILVRVDPGLTPEAVTPVPVRSADRPSISPATACLTVPYAVRWNSPVRRGCGGDGDEPAPGGVRSGEHCRDGRGRGVPDAFDVDLPQQL